MALNEGFDRGGPDASKPGSEALKGQNRKKGKQEWKNGKGGVTLLATQHTEWAPDNIDRWCFSQGTGRCEVRAGQKNKIK